MQLDIVTFCSTANNVLQPSQQPSPPAFPQQAQNDDVMMGQRLGANLGAHFRDQEAERPRLPFGTQVWQ